MGEDQNWCAWKATYSHNCGVLISETEKTFTVQEWWTDHLGRNTRHFGSPVITGMTKRGALALVRCIQDSEKEMRDDQRAAHDAHDGRVAALIVAATPIPTA